MRWFRSREVERLDGQVQALTYICLELEDRLQRTERMLGLRHYQAGESGEQDRRVRQLEAIPGGLDRPDHRLKRAAQEMEAAEKVRGGDALAVIGGSGGPYPEEVPDGLGGTTPTFSDDRSGARPDPRTSPHAPHRGPSGGAT